MKAIIRLDVPDWQIGQNVSVYFPDTMLKKAVCEKEEGPVAPGVTHDYRGLRYVCGVCGATLYTISDTATAEYKIRHNRFCPECGHEVLIAMF